MVVIRYWMPLLGLNIARVVVVVVVVVVPTVYSTKCNTLDTGLFCSSSTQSR
jgi:hypothetical protein